MSTNLLTLELTDDKLNLENNLVFSLMKTAVSGCSYSGCRGSTPKNEVGVSDTPLFLSTS